MSPSIFFQLSDSGKLTMLYKEGIYTRERVSAVYTIQLFIMEGNYYEIWKMNDTGRIIHISMLDEENALILFPGICEKEILGKKNK